MITSPTTPVRFRTAWVLPGAAAAFYFAAAFLVVGLWGKWDIASVCIIALASILGTWFLLSIGSLEIGPDAVRYEDVTSVLQIRWSDVKKIETDGNTFVLADDERRLPIVPMYFRAGDRTPLLLALETQWDRRGIPIEEDRRASSRLAWNVRVSRGS